MSKCVLVSIKPQWCNLIANRRKMYEVRKSRPNIEPPFKVYVYCTKSGNETYLIWDEKKRQFREAKGTVIGEFICDEIITFDKFKTGETYTIAERVKLADGSAMNFSDIREYADGKTIYLWHISSYKPYKEAIYLVGKPPQSWRYIEEEK